MSSLNIVRLVIIRNSMKLQIIRRVFTGCCTSDNSKMYFTLWDVSVIIYIPLSTNSSNHSDQPFFY